MHFRRSLLLTLYKLSDIVIPLMSVAFLTVFRSYTGDPSTLEGLLSAHIRIPTLFIIIMLIGTWHIIFRSLKLYQSRRLGSKAQECRDVIKATTLGTCAVVVLINVFQLVTLQGSFIVLFWISSTCLTITMRMTMRLLLIIMRNRGRNLRHVVIIGTNKRAQSFAKKIRKRKDLGYNLIGFVDNRYPGTTHQVELISDLNHFPEVLKKHVVDEVIIGLPIKSFYEKIRRIVSACEEQGIVVRFLTDLFDMNFSKSRVEHLEGSSILTLYSGPSDTVSLIIKRGFDLLLSAIALLLLSPLFIIVGIFIKLDSPGPIFFVQERVGYNKRRFRVYKFRTMINNAEIQQEALAKHNEMIGPVFKIKNDPRITRVGKILRRTSFDELPQLFNIVNGDMSLVGPRPLPVVDYNGFNKNWQKRRFSIKPGITCLWQVNGRNIIPFEKWMELDMEYIDNWSLLLDLKILVKTILAVTRRLGAY